MLVDRSCPGARPGLPLTNRTSRAGPGGTPACRRGRAMEILIGAAVVALGLVAAATLLTRRVPGLAGHPPPPAAEVPRPATVTADDGDLAERRAEVIALGHGLRARKEAVEVWRADWGHSAHVFDKRLADIEVLKDKKVRELEQTAG